LAAAVSATVVLLVAAGNPTHGWAAGNDPPKSEPLKPALSSGFTFGERTGEALYKNACQACHMPDGKGATGAGAYPALAADTALGARGYPVYVVVNGQRAMPPFGDLMDDGQVAAVVNYVRTHLGNTYNDEVTADDVQIVRQK
jgi:mono/diheme cytochrome c family protein